MKQKNIKVAYTSRNTGGSYTQVPKIQMEGRWLESLAFPSEAPLWWSMTTVPSASVR